MLAYAVAIAGMGIGIWLAVTEGYVSKPNTQLSPACLDYLRLLIRLAPL